MVSMRLREGILWLLAELLLILGVSKGDGMKGEAADQW